MRERRFYYSGTIESGAELLLVGEEFKHIKVLRLSRGAHINIFDGHGIEADAVIVGLARDCAKIKIEKVWKAEKGAPPVILAVSPLKANRMDYLLEKSCELGVDQIWPILFERTVVKIEQKQWAKKSARWGKILISAAKQSGRTDMPHIAESIPIQKVKERLKSDDLLILCDRVGAHPSELDFSQAKRVVIFVGPEGGLVELEKSYLVKSGAKKMLLSDNVLRTETACVAALSIIGSMLTKGGKGGKR